MKRLKMQMLATVALVLLAGCSSSDAPHGGLVPDISGSSTVTAKETESYNFDASSAYGYRLAYGVNWGDGTKPLVTGDVSSSSSVSADHAWVQPGNYTIAVTVSDGHGESGFATYNVQVNPAPIPEP